MTESTGRRFAWVVLLLVVGLVGAAAVVDRVVEQAAGPVPSLGPETGPETGTETGPAGEVVVVGAPGLSWDDIDPELTPTLWKLTDEGASGGLVVRGTHEVTCPSDGWLTLSAGQRASTDTDGVQDCSSVPVVQVADEETTDEAADGSGDEGVPVTLPEWGSWQEAADRRPLEAHLGSLAGAVEDAGGCVAAVGPRAALGAGHTSTGDGSTGEGGTGDEGRVADYRDGGLTAYSPGGCAVTLLDGGFITGPEVAAGLDADLAGLLEQLPADATLLVAGLSDRGGEPALRAALVWREGMVPGALRSSTTNQTNLVQTTDLTATVLDLAGVEVPAAVSGRPIGVITNRLPAADRVDALQDLSAGIDGARSLAVPVLGSAAVLVVLGAIALLRARAYGPLRALGLVAMAFPSAAFLVGLVPWWLGSPPGLTLALATTAIAGAHLGLALAGPWRTHPLGPPTVIAALTVVVIGADVVLGGRLGLTSILGVQPLSAGRFHGMGNVGFGIFAAAGLLLTGSLVSLLRSRPGSRRLAAVLAVGVLGLLLVLVDGAPMWGTDFGGVPALVVGLGLLGLAAAEIRLTPLRALLIGAGAVLAAGALMLLDWLRPAESRTHLGQFAQSLLDGEALGIIGRKLDQSLGILVRYPVSWVAVLALVLVAWAVLRPESRLGRPLAPLWRIPHLRTTAAAVLVCLTVGWALNDSGIAIVGIGLAVTIAAGLGVRAYRIEHSN